MTTDTSAARRKRIIPIVGAVIAIVLGALVALRGGRTESSDGIAATTAEALHQRLAGQGKAPLIVDVREPAEFAAGHIEGARLAPLGTVVEDLQSVERDRQIVLVCHSGRRSAKAYEALAGRGFTHLENLEGGMVGWEKRGYPVVKK